MLLGWTLGRDSPTRIFGMAYRLDSMVFSPLKIFEHHCNYTTRHVRSSVLSCVEFRKRYVSWLLDLELGKGSKLYSYKTDREMHVCLVYLYLKTNCTLHSRATSPSVTHMFLDCLLRIEFFEGKWFIKPSLLAASFHLMLYCLYCPYLDTDSSITEFVKLEQIRQKTAPSAVQAWRKAPRSLLCPWGDLYLSSLEITAGQLGRWANTTLWVTSIEPPKGDPLLTRTPHKSEDCWFALHWPLQTLTKTYPARSSGLELLLGWNGYHGGKSLRAW